MGRPHRSTATAGRQHRLKDTAASAAQLRTARPSPAPRAWLPRVSNAVPNPATTARQMLGGHVIECRLT